MAAARYWWFGPWFIVEQLLPGATLFAILFWLSQRFVSGGFADVRQYAFAPPAGKWAAAPARNWWSCTCVRGTCVCLDTVVHAVRRCCMKVAERGAMLAPRG